VSTQSSHPGNGGPVSTTGALGGAPPHSLEAEQSVLGAILLSERSITQVVIEEGLRPEDFYRRRHGVVFEAMLALYAENEPIDVLTVNDRLRAHSNLEEAGGDSAVDSLTGGVPVAGNARRYARIVKEQALLRGALTATYEIQAKVTERDGAPRDIVEWAERRMLDVAHDDRQKDFKSIEDVLFTELDKLERLSREGTALTGTPSGFKALDDITGGFQPGNLVIIAARPSMGKCQSGSTLVYDAMSGTRRRLDEVVAAHERGEETWVASVAPDLRLRPSKVTAVHRNGLRPLFRLTTRLGRRTDATTNHPFLTLTGWRRLDELRTGDRLAVPRCLPRRDKPKRMPDHDVVLLAALIADGCLRNATPRFIAAEGSAVLAEVLAATDAIGAKSHVGQRGTNVEVGLSGRSRRTGNPATELCRRHGIMGKRSEDKFVPDAIFGLSERQIVRFLGILFGCDGHLYVTDRLRQIGYSTISERLARDVQHLLLRLGIVSRIRTLKRSVYDGTDKVAREVLITGQAGLGAFCSLISVCGKEERGRRVLAGLDAVGAGTNTDTVPAGVWHQVLKVKGERSWSEVSRATGHPPNHNWHVGSRGLSRERLTTLADWSGDEGLHHLATSDLWWDEIASIEPIGEDETYDLTVPGDHNFVADDIVVHNSALVTNIAENVALDHGKAVALFSLEMSEAELAQRFLASQADVPGDHLRKGRVKPGKWSSVVGASRRLAAAPLWVDDSSDVGLLEVRAKARRLHQQHELGLIIIDYLQLLRPDGSQDSRVLQIGEMSRGLKILAGELQVPVIALSQLSRAVESRTDKHPMLSDLRESGSIEQDSDLVMFIYRDEYYDPETERQGEADLIIAKHRSGGLGTVPLVFQKDFPRFRTMLHDPERFG
jgi:replicative DNA helicase